MNRKQFVKQLVGLLSSAKRGGWWLFAFAGLLFFIALSGISDAFQPAAEQNCSYITTAGYPASPEEALQGNPPSPLQCGIRNSRFQRTLAPFRLSPTAVPSAPFLLTICAFTVLTFASLVFLNIQNGIFTSILVRAGPLCFEKIQPFQRGFHHQRHKELFYQD